MKMYSVFKILYLLPTLSLLLGCGALQVGYSPLHESCQIEEPESYPEDALVVDSLQMDVASATITNALPGLDSEISDKIFGKILIEYHSLVESVLKNPDADAVRKLQQSFAHRVMIDGNRFRDPIEIYLRAVLSLLDCRPDDALYDARMAYGLTLTRDIPTQSMEPLPEFDWPVGKYSSTGATQGHDKRIFSAYRQYISSKSAESIRRLDLRISMRPLPKSARIGKRGNLVYTIYEEDLNITPAFPLVVDYSMDLREIQARISYLITLCGILTDDLEAVRLGSDYLKNAIDPVWIRDEYRNILAFSGFLLDDQKFRIFSNQRIDYILGWQDPSENNNLLNIN